MFFGRFASGPRAIVRVQCAQALIMGSIEQPDSIEKGLDFYDDKQDVQIHEGETPGAGISIGKSDWGRVLESQGLACLAVRLNRVTVIAVSCIHGLLCQVCIRCSSIIPKCPLSRARLLCVTSIKVSRAAINYLKVLET
jgi:hypothetical protein